MGTFSSETSANRHNSGKFETLIALQNDPRWLLLHSWFSKFPRGRPPDLPTRKDARWNFGSRFLSNLCATPPPTSHTDTKTLLFARHLPKTIYDFLIRGFICSLWGELPLPPPFSPTLLLLLLGGKGTFPAVFFFLFVFFCFFFFWKR